MFTKKINALKKKFGSFDKYLFVLCIFFFFGVTKAKSFQKKKNLYYFMY